MGQRRTDSEEAQPSVEIIRWPGDALLREHLRQTGVPRLLVLEAGSVPPRRVDDLEDSMWTPTDERDLFARLNRLASRHPPAPAPRLAPGEVVIDAEGVLAYRDAWASLPRAEAQIMRLLARPPGRVRSRDELQTAIWGDEDRKAHSLDSRIFTLRARLSPVGLAVRSVHGRGFLLAASA